MEKDYAKFDSLASEAYSNIQKLQDYLETVEKSFLKTEYANAIKILERIQSDLGDDLFLTF